MQLHILCTESKTECLSVQSGYVKGILSQKQAAKERQLQNMLCPLNSYVFEVCLGVSSRNIVNKNYLLGKNVLMDIVHFISSTTYICISMCISLNTTMLSKHENTV